MPKQYDYVFHYYNIFPVSIRAHVASFNHPSFVFPLILLIIVDFFISFFGTPSQMYDGNIEKKIILNFIENYIKL
jgi:hypothetical protein